MIQAKKDEILNEYWADKRRFADLFNGVVFEGRQLLKPEDLTELDSSYPTTIEKKGSYSLTRYRDVIKMAAYGAEFQIIAGSENQNKIHYAMPVRGFLYDALGYVRQCKQIESDHTNADYKDDAEYLSRFKKTDQLIPIFTITMYYGEKPWDGPIVLSEMMQVDPDLLEYYNDYHINLVSVRSGETNWKIFHTEIAQFFQLMNSLKDIESLHRYVTEHPDMEIDTTTVNATAVAADSRDLLRLAEQNKRRGKIKMCTAIEDLKREGRLEGRLEGQMRGELMNLLALVRKKLIKGLDSTEIADIFEEDENKIRRICEAIKQNPEASDEELVQELLNDR